MKTIYRKDMLYVPTSLINESYLKRNFRKDHFNETVCSSRGEGNTVCKEKPHRPNEICHSCPGFQGRYNFFRKGKINKKSYTGLAVGKINLLKGMLGNLSQYNIVDLRVDDPMSTGLKFVGKLYDYQKEAVDVMARHKRGLLKSKPRTGKTIMMIALLCRIGQKTLVITHQDDLLEQFYTAFHSETPIFTNASKLDSPVKLVERNSDFDVPADVHLSTYQRFLKHNSVDLLERIAGKYGCVVVDEIHRGNADCYSKVISHLHPTWMYGCSGTIQRKDGKEFIIDRILGPVLHETPAKVLRPKVIVQLSKMNSQVRAKQWVYIIRDLCRHNGRNMDIVRNVIADLKKGHSIVIPCTFRWYIDAMVEEINKQWMNDSSSNQIVAKPFYAMPKKYKEQTLDEARNGKIRVVVALRSMLLGVNVPRWSALYSIIPMNNPPVLEQETMRICTPFEGKNNPIIRFFVDITCTASVRCFWACFNVMKKLNFKTDLKKNEEILNDLASIVRSPYVDRTIQVGRPGKRITI